MTPEVEAAAARMCAIDWRSPGGLTGWCHNHETTVDRPRVACSVAIGHARHIVRAMASMLMASTLTEGAS